MWEKGQNTTKKNTYWKRTSNSLCCIPIYPQLLISVRLHPNILCNYEIGVLKISCSNWYKIHSLQVLRTAFDMCYMMQLHPLTETKELWGISLRVGFILQYLSKRRLCACQQIWLIIIYCQWSTPESVMGQFLFALYSSARSIRYMFPQTVILNALNAVLGTVKKLSLAKIKAEVLLNAPRDLLKFIQAIYRKAKKSLNFISTSFFWR